MDRVARFLAFGGCLGIALTGLLGWHELVPTPPQTWDWVRVIGAILSSLAIGSAVLGTVLLLIPGLRKSSPAPIFNPVTHLGAGDGTTKCFRTTTPYQLGSLHVYVNGLQQDSIETDPANGDFELTFSPTVDDRIGASWVVGQPAKHRPWAPSRRETLALPARAASPRTQVSEPEPPSTGVALAPSATIPDKAIQTGTASLSGQVDNGAADEPPADWGAPYWEGKQILRCPYCAYRTVSINRHTEHAETHTEPPTAGDARSVYPDVPRPWARVQVHFLGDGSAYVNGVPADPKAILFTTASRADELLATGLYGLGPPPDRTPHQPSPPDVPGTTGPSYVRLLESLDRVGKSWQKLTQKPTPPRADKESIRENEDWPARHTPGAMFGTRVTCRECGRTFEGLDFNAHQRGEM